MSSHKGQQGCPLMMPLFCAMKKEMRDRVDSRVDGIGDVDFVADFADDGVDGGDYECVLKTLRGDWGAFAVTNNFTKMKVYLLAGELIQGESQWFERIGYRDRLVRERVIYAGADRGDHGRYERVGGGENKRYNEGLGGAAWVVK